MLKSEENHQVNSRDKMPVCNVEELFNFKRILVIPKLYKAILYFPFGLLLLFIRSIVCFLGVLILSFLPKTSHTRSIILKGLCKVLGLVIKVDDKHLDETAKLLVANHVSILDRLAVNVMVPCNSLSKDFHIKNLDSVMFWKDDIRYSRNLTREEISALRMYMEGSSVKVLSFPEGTVTNGRLGLLKFHSGIFALNDIVQPIVICVSMSSFITVSPATISSSVCGDLFWAFFLPCTSFTLKVLPSIIKLPEESAEDYAKRVQESMATSLNISPTIYSASDKDELIKRLKTSASINSSRKASSKENPKEKDITFLKDGNISNLQLSMNTAADSFGKTPKQRMASYQERRTKLLEAAKMKYLQKQCQLKS